jgi:hypothetical protein
VRGVLFQVRTSCQQSASSAKREEEGQVFYSSGTILPLVRKVLAGPGCGMGWDDFVSGTML